MVTISSSWRQVGQWLPQRARLQLDPPFMHLQTIAALPRCVFLQETDKQKGESHKVRETQLGAQQVRYRPAHNKDDQLKIPHVIT